MSFTFTGLAIPEVILVESNKFGDDRGHFRETFKASEFGAAGITMPFVQDNYARSKRGVLRGLHYQKNPMAQGKYVLAYEGRIFDVAVDIRRGSPTFGKWVGEELSSDDGCGLYVPPGFAHGYCVLSEWATVAYKVTSEYNPSAERGIIWNDPVLKVAWPIKDPILSAKDLLLPPLDAADNNFLFE